jgi:hypothetical protein
MPSTLDMAVNRIYSESEFTEIRQCVKANINEAKGTRTGLDPASGLGSGRAKYTHL